MPRLSLWRKQPDALSLEVIGTDAVLDLRSEADVAIRNAATLPEDGVAKALFRESFWPICSPRLLSGHRPFKRAAELRGQVLIHFHWPPFVPNAATWHRWLTADRRRWRDVPETNEMDHLSFREELHAIEAVLAGQGIGMLSDLLVADELKAGGSALLSRPSGRPSAPARNRRPLELAAVCPVIESDLRAARPWPGSAGSRARPRPEQVGMLLLAGGDDTPVRQDQLDRHEVFQGEAMLAHEPAVSRVYVGFHFRSSEDPGDWCCKAALPAAGRQRKLETWFRLFRA